MSATDDRTRRRLAPEERREQLVGATVRVLDRQGYAATTAAAVAREAGLSKGLLWHYFDDLDDLMEVTARRTLLELRAAVAERVDPDAPASEFFRQAVRGAAVMRLTHGAQRRALAEIVANLRGADGAPRLGAADYEDTYAAQEAVLRRGQQEGDVRAELDARMLVLAYQGVVEAMLSHLDAHPEVDGEAYAEAVADLLLDGFRSRPHH